VIASNLQGQQSARPFWRKFPSISIFQYQCSPLSASESIQHQVGRRPLSVCLSACLMLLCPALVWILHLAAAALLQSASLARLLAH
jgi:hypothetical protein